MHTSASYRNVLGGSLAVLLEALTRFDDVGGTPLRTPNYTMVTNIHVSAHKNGFSFLLSGGSL